MKLGLLLSILLISFSSHATTNCEVALLKSVLYEIRISDLRSENLDCQHGAISNPSCNAVKNKISQVQKELEVIQKKSIQLCSQYTK